MRGRKRNEMDHALAVKFSVDAFNQVPDCLTCPGRFADLMDRLAKFAESDMQPINSPTKKPAQMGQEFKAKKARLLYDSRRHVHVQSDKATDQEIISLLASQPGAIKHFDAPKDWEKKVEAFKESLQEAHEKKVEKLTGGKGPKKTNQTFASALSNAKTFEDVVAEIEAGTKKGLAKLAKTVGADLPATMTTEEMKAALKAKAAQEFGVDINPANNLEEKTDEKLRELAEQLQLDAVEGLTREELIAAITEAANTGD